MDKKIEKKYDKLASHIALALFFFIIGGAVTELSAVAFGTVLLVWTTLFMMFLFYALGHDKGQKDSKDA